MSADEPAFPADAIEVARIGEAWGVLGWFKVVPFSTDPQAIFSCRRWFIKAPLPSSTAAAPLRRPALPTLPELLRITGVKEHGDSVVAQAQGIESRADAQALRGARVFVGRSSFPTQGSDEFYWVDLIGLQVVNRQGEALGVVAGLIETGPQSVLRVVAESAGADAADAAAERLIPFVAAYVDEVSLERKRIQVDWNLDY
jgi:16S rRNA processing protein RimM